MPRAIDFDTLVQTKVVQAYVLVKHGELSRVLSTAANADLARSRWCIISAKDAAARLFCSWATEALNFESKQVRCDSTRPRQDRRRQLPMGKAVSR